ncbi:MAG: NAD(P)H-dependent oxidoreductase [Parcubacteria group bacterium]|nr:NAD(P)H-dependent oxidoreductase [Parcubacteria group bacterium]
MNTITIILSTARDNNFTSRIADIVRAHVAGKGFDVQFVDIKDFLFGKTMTLADNPKEVALWAEIVAKSDGVIFVAPEYNHTYPGELKILLDSLTQEYAGKPAGIVSVSAGDYAGVRMVDALKILLHTLGFRLANRSVNVGNVQTDINEGRITKHLNTVLEEMKDLQK